MHVQSNDRRAAGFRDALPVPADRLDAMPTTPPENPAAPAPSVSDLREIAEFLRARSLDEARTAGAMDFYRERGATIQVRLPKQGAPGSGVGLSGDPAEHRAKYKGWMDEHSPDRFVDMAHVLADLADSLADRVADAGSALGDYPARAAWRRLTSAARLWETHPDFLPVWAKQNEA